MTKTTTANYLSIAAPGNSFNARISADSDIFARNDIDALGSALDLHDHTAGKGLAAGALATSVTLTGTTTLTGAGVVVNSGGLTITAGGITVTAGNVGIGTAPVANAGLYATGATLSGNTSQYSLVAQSTGSSAATAEITAVLAGPFTAAAAFTCTTVTGFHAQNPSKGAGSTITSAYGLLVDAITTGGTNNYGAFINQPSTGATMNAALYLNGSSASLVINSGGNVPVTTSGFEVAFSSVTTAGANAGANGAPPAQVAGYIVINVGGTQRKIPYYAT